MPSDLKTSKISELEEKILKYWQEKKIFEKSVERRAPRGDYVFYDGPPFATGLPHYGHILASVIKDVVPRYQTMKGHRVERVWGWDCHGLPMENLIEQKLGLKTKKDIEKFGVGKFNEEARKDVLKYADDWARIIPRIGRWVDMKNAYKTMDPTYTESVWWVFKKLFDKQLVYEGYKSMHICPRCETTLSNFEVAQGYKDIEDPSAYIKFQITNSKFQKPTYLLVWTTTPWTLPGNAALAVGEKIQYKAVEKNGEILILALELIGSVVGNVDRNVRDVSASDLIGLEYEPLFSYYAKDKKLDNHKNGWKIYGADFVKTDEGTGIVHIAPAFGADDMALGKKYHLPFIQHVGIDGHFKKEVKEFAGLPVKPKEKHQATDEKIIAWLDKNKKLFKSEKIIHAYPHCWRCDTPLLNYAASSWFVKVTAIKKDLLSSNKRVKWIPAHIKDGRFGKILEEAPDWGVSRSRFWGAPLPVWRCQGKKSPITKHKAKTGCGKIKVIGSVQELKDDLRQSGNQYFLMRHGEAESVIQDISASSYETSRKYPLTEKGKEQVMRAAQKLQREIKREKIDLIFSSDLLRTKQTAQILAEAIGFPEKKIIFDKRLREVGLGSFDGQKADKYRKYATAEGKFTKSPPGGENLAELKNRVADFFYEIDSRHKNKKILIVSHEYPIWLMIAASEGRNAKGTVKLKEEREKKDSGGNIVSPAEIISLDFAPLPHNQNYELDLHRPYIDEAEFKCECGGKMKRVPYVFDCWFESGSMPYGQSHYPFENKEKFEKNFPAQFIAEGADQTRGWFYTLIVLSTALFKKPAYKNVIVNGIVLAEDGQKMSKRLKNYPDPMDIVAKYGADALRYYLLSAPVVRAEDFNFSEKGVDEIYKKVILRLLNVFNFYEMYGEKSKVKNQKSKVSSRHILDMWIITRLNQLIAETTKAMEKYELDRAARPIAEFIDDLSTWYIRRSRERFKAAGRDRDTAIATTHHVLNELVKVAAPIMPFLADWLYLKLNPRGKTESVHLEKWPMIKVKGSGENKKIIEMAELRRIISVGLQARAVGGVRVRQPIKSITINKNSIIRKNAELIEELKAELNAKEILFDKNNSLGDSVQLNFEITQELREEGIMREFVRLIQGLRQRAGYTPKDKISVWLEVPEVTREALNHHLNSFKERIGAKSIEFRRTHKFDAELETQIDSQKIWVGIKKI